MSAAELDTAVPVPPPTAQSSVHNSLNIQNNEQTFDYCQIHSLDEGFQSSTCSCLNLRLFPYVQSVMTLTQAAAADELEHLIYRSTNISTHVTIDSTSGDGNCLFRALSNAVCRSQTYHDLFRQYIVNHMTDPLIEGKLEQLFDSGDRSKESYNRHLLIMQESGEWGTEKEIITAAHMLQCSIVCFSKYNTDNKYCLQHFPPHFIDSTDCTDGCQHKTIYLVNNSGMHYESAVVTYTHL